MGRLRTFMGRNALIWAVLALLLGFCETNPVSPETEISLMTITKPMPPRFITSQVACYAVRIEGKIKVEVFTQGLADVYVTLFTYKRITRGYKTVGETTKRVSTHGRGPIYTGKVEFDYNLDATSERAYRWAVKAIERH